MIQRLDELENAKMDFALETTLASKTFAARIARLRTRGYIFALLYLWLPNPEDSISRVRERVRRGGHHVPDEIIRRRHRRGLENFFRLYRPISDIWRFYDNTDPDGPRLVASGVRATEQILDPTMWRRVIGGDSRMIPRANIDPATIDWDAVDELHLAVQRAVWVQATRLPHLRDERRQDAVDPARGNRRRETGGRLTHAGPAFVPENDILAFDGHSAA